MNELAERSANEEQLISNEDKTKPINEKKEEQIDTSVNKKEKVIEVKEKKKNNIKMLLDVMVLVQKEQLCLPMYLKYGVHEMGKRLILSL